MWNWTRWMQMISFAATAGITIGLLMGVGWLYKFGKVDKSDAILIYVLGQFVTLFGRLVSKYNRVDMPDDKKHE